MVSSEAYNLFSLSLESIDENFGYWDKGLLNIGINVVLHGADIRRPAFRFSH